MSPDSWSIPELFVENSSHPKYQCIPEILRKQLDQDYSSTHPTQTFLSLRRAYSKTINCVALSKGIQDILGFWIPRSGFWILGTGFRFIVGGIWIPDSNRQWDSGFLELYSRFQRQLIQISLLWEESRIGHFLVAFLDEMIYKKYNKYWFSMYPWRSSLFSERRLISTNDESACFL